MVCVDLRFLLTIPAQANPRRMMLGPTGPLPGLRLFPRLGFSIVRFSTTPSPGQPSAHLGVGNGTQNSGRGLFEGPTAAERLLAELGPARTSMLAAWMDQLVYLRFCTSTFAKVPRCECSLPFALVFRALAHLFWKRGKTHSGAFLIACRPRSCSCSPAPPLLGGIQFHDEVQGPIGSFTPVGGPRNLRDTQPAHVAGPERRF